MISRFLDTVGDGSGGIDGTADYSTVADSLLITPPAGKRYTLTRMIVSIQDTGSFDAEKYGNNVTLTNGITVKVIDSVAGTVIDLLGGQTVKSNVGWAAYCYDAEVKSWGSGDEFLVARWTFEKSGVDVVLTENDSLEVGFNDNLTTLGAHRFLVQGFSEDL